jgi:hypothetical protein
MALDRINATALLDGGVTSADLATQTGNVDFADNARIRLGDSQDFQIYHDGGSSWVSDVGAGNLKLSSDGAGVFLQKGATEFMGEFLTDGAVKLYHDNSLKFSTSATGVDVTGAISSNKGSAGTLATFTDGVNSNFVVETSSLLTTIGNGAISTALALKSNNTEAMRIDSNGNVAMLNHASIGVNAPASTRALTVAGATDGSGSSILVCYNSSLAQKFSVRDDGYITATGDIQVGGGVYLGGTGSANYLDDYEEGTWTPTFQAASDPTVTYSIRAGYYTKVGSLVTVWCWVSTNSVSGGSGSLRITGLPFSEVTRNTGYVVAGNWSADHPISVRVSSGAAFLYSRTAFASSDLNNNTQVSDMSSASGGYNAVEFTVSYRVS